MKVLTFHVASILPEMKRLRHWKIEQAVSRFQKQEITLARAAEEAGLSLYEMMDELQRRGIALDQSTPEEARREIQTLLKQMAT